ncbi:tRNA-dihydrouridine synthase [Vibrio lentus]|nr:tRNA-dihydrouridine synthase [Vibrio lentus]
MSISYDEVNLNVGCPSDRVQEWSLWCMLDGYEPELLADCVSASMKEVTDIPITVKTRIGIDDQDSYEFLTKFVSTVSEKVAVSNLLFMLVKHG